MWGRDIAAELRRGVDSVSVSLNTADAAQWRRLHAPLRPYAEDGFESVLRFLHGLEQRGSYAAVFECALEKNDPDTDYVKPAVTFSALHVDLAARKPSADDEEEEGPKKTKKPPRGTWR